MEILLTVVLTAVAIAVVAWIAYDIGVGSALHRAHREEVRSASDGLSRDP